MNEWIKKADAYLAAREIRERALLAAVVLAVVYLLLDSILIQPTYKSMKSQRAKVVQTNEQLVQVEQTLMITQAKVKAAAEQDSKTLVRIEDELTQIEQGLSEMTKGFVPAAVMASALEDMLVHVSDLKLLSMENLPVDDVFATSVAAADEPKSLSGDANESIENALFRHGIEIRLEGSYVASRQYIRKLEALPWRFDWGNMQFVVKEYPVGILTLRIHTFSTQREWLGV